MSMSFGEVEWSPYPVGRVGTIRHCDFHEDCDAADRYARTVGNASEAYHWPEPPMRYSSCESADRAARQLGLIEAVHCHLADCTLCQSHRHGS